MAYDLLDPNNGRSPDSNHIKNDIYKYEASRGSEKEVSSIMLMYNPRCLYTEIR